MRSDYLEKNKKNWKSLEDISNRMAILTVNEQFIILFSIVKNLIRVTLSPNLQLILALILSLNLFIIDSNAQKAELVVQTGHAGKVQSVSFSPDGKIFATGAVDETIKLWDANTGQELRTLSQASNDNKQTMWVNSVTFSPDSRTIASASWEEIKLWDVVTGQLLKVLKGHKAFVRAVVFSPDGKILASAGDEVKLWDVKSGVELKTFPTITQSQSIAFSSDGKMLASGANWTEIKIWDVSSGQLLKKIVANGRVRSIVFSPDCKTLASKDGDNIVKLWSVFSGEELKDFGKSPKLNTYNEEDNSALAFSPDGQTIASSGFKEINIWNVFSGEEIRTLKSSSLILSIAFSPDGKTLVSGSFDNSVDIWDIVSSQKLKSVEGHTSYNYSVAFSPDDKIIASGGQDGLIRLWDLESNKNLMTLKGKYPNYSVWSVSFSPDGRILASANPGDILTLWNAGDGKILNIINSQVGIASISFSPNNKIIALGSHNKTITLWDVNSGLKIKTLQKGINEEENDDIDEDLSFLTFSLDGKILASAESSMDLSGNLTSFIVLWDIASGRKLRSMKINHPDISQIAFLTDRRIFTLSKSDGIVKLWDNITNELIRTYQINDPSTINELLVKAPDFFRRNDQQPITKDKKFQIKTEHNTKIEIYEVKTGRLLARLIALDENDWAVITPDGLFDASPKARKLMHYIVGLEPVSLEQMKDVYYVPGLLQKIFKSEPLPKIPLFEKKDLFPDVEFSQTGQNDLNIKLTNRGGGIGQVQILINGKEFISDARPADFDVNSKKAEFNISLKDAPFIPGQENKIEVIAKNASGSLSNRGSPRGSKTATLAGTVKKETPNIYVIAGGISDYTGDNLKLNYAAKDAEEFAKTIELGAAKLLSDKSKVHIRLLTSDGEKANVKLNVPDAKISTATKKDFETAFTDFKNATANDVFIVYLSGHGVALNLNQNPKQAGGDTYLYLTQEATTTDKSTLALAGSRKAMTVSSDELKDLMKQNKSLKQVLILDTCAAGALSNSFAKREDIPASQIKAMETLKDNTGFFVLMGASADAVSYEANKYGQGLLTYSLLEAMKGARLHDGSFAFVEDLFGYAQERVPFLAKEISQTQRPITITPETSGNFPIGQFTTEEQKQIVLSNPKPIILRPILRNTAKRFDDLKLTQQMVEQLRRASYIQPDGRPSKIVFVDTDEMTDGIQPVGDYTVEGDSLKISIILVKNNVQIVKEITVTGMANEMEKTTGQIVSAIMKSLQ